MFQRILFSVAIIFSFFTLFSYADSKDNKEQTSNQEVTTPSLRIVSLSGTVSEILYSLGLEEQIVGVDVTSVYPERLQGLPKVGHSHNLNVEAIIGLEPDYVISMVERGLKPEQVEQLKQAGIEVWTINQEYTLEGTKKIINDIGVKFNREEEAKKMIQKIDKDIAEIPSSESHPKVLFVYARGAGSLQVAGDKTPMGEVITLAGGEHATKGQFDYFKPLTAEALVSANPDYILLFDVGLESLEGPEGLLKVPGVAQTNAGKNKKFIIMDGLLLAGFGPRVGEAVKQLHNAIH